MSRDNILHKVRTALGRSAGQPIPELAPARIRIPEIEIETRITRMLACVEALAGTTYRAAGKDQARDLVRAALAGRTAVASNAPFLAECGIHTLEGVRSGIRDCSELRELCISAGVGITSADYALAETGTLVMLSSVAEARMISLLPPAHIAVVPRARVLTGLDELFSILPHPAEATSSMVTITGPSRTADIEQILVRGVHGPGEFTVVVVD
jgi:L-lactate dehydrogenase complex protein LldG